MDSPNLTSLDPWGFDVRRVDKPWGHELVWALTDVYCGKVLFVKAGPLAVAAVPSREGRVMARAVGPGEAGARRRRADARSPKKSSEQAHAFHYRPGTVHRVTALEDTTILEVSTPQLDDVVRLEDAYGREGTSAP